jgi:hypothetical protein
VFICVHLWTIYFLAFNNLRSFAEKIVFSGRLLMAETALLAQLNEGLLLDLFSFDLVTLNKPLRESCFHGLSVKTV